MKKLMIFLVGVVASAMSVAVIGQVTVLNNTQAQALKLEQEQTEKALQNLKKLQEYGYTEVQVITMLHEAVARAAETGDPFIVVKSDNKIWWYVGGVVILVGVFAGGYFLGKHVSKPKLNNPQPGQGNVAQGAAAGAPQTGIATGTGGVAQGATGTSATASNPGAPAQASIQAQGQQVVPASQVVQGGQAVIPQSSIAQPAASLSVNPAASQAGVGTGTGGAAQGAAGTSAAASNPGIPAPASALVQGQQAAPTGPVGALAAVQTRSAAVVGGVIVGTPGASATTQPVAQPTVSLPVNPLSASVAPVATAPSGGTLGAVPVAPVLGQASVSGRQQVEAIVRAHGDSPAGIAAVERLLMDRMTQSGLPPGVTQSMVPPMISLMAPHLIRQASQGGVDFQQVMQQVLPQVLLPTMMEGMPPEQQQMMQQTLPMLAQNPQLLPLFQQHPQEISQMMQGATDAQRQIMLNVLSRNPELHTINYLRQHRDEV